MSDASAAFAVSCSTVAKRASLASSGLPMCPQTSAQYLPGWRRCTPRRTGRRSSCCDPHRVVVAVVRYDREHRAEHLLLRDLAVRVHVDEQRRCVEVAGVHLLAAGHEHRACRDRPLDQAVHLVPLPLADQRAM
jgi:hypothetical protein